MLTKPIDHTALAPSMSLNTALHSKAQKLEDRDTVSLSTRKLLTEEEAQQTMVDVEQQINAQKDEALSVHSGLSLNRVMELLGGL